MNLVSAENLDRFMEEQLRNADSILHPDWLCRDGAFEFDRFWLVWDREDLERLAGWLLDPMKALHASGHRVGEIAIPMPAGGGLTMRESFVENSSQFMRFVAPAIDLSR